MKPEILAPAGDRECFDAALRFGADAVYLAGTQFGMRTAPANFTQDQLRQAVADAHRQGVKVYVACNVLPRGEQLRALPAFLEELDDMGADAVIAADLGVMALVRRYAPHTALNASTQVGIVNGETARVLADLGAARAILARELSLEEIAAIRAEAPPEIELEAFVHGAMCVSYSARCLLSAYFTGRHADQGDCAQPCRWEYRLTEVNRPDQPLTVRQTEEGTFLLNAQDLCMLDHLPALCQAGVTACKIEGRAKAAYYVACMTQAYRMAADGYAASGFSAGYRVPAWLLAEADKVSHRPYGTGFYFGPPQQTTDHGGYIRRYTVAAVVEGYADGCLLATQRNRFFAGCTLDALIPGRPPRSIPVPALFDGEGNPIPSAPHPMMRLRIPCPEPLPVGSVLRLAL
ncbi:MAG: U32 family peptidase [Clostridia bacterium]|nr:U32 family peptidase [Clostridia bacterium]